MSKTEAVTPEQQIHNLEDILKESVNNSKSLEDKLKENPEVEKIINSNPPKFSGWNYRIVRQYSKEEGMYYDQIHEVYYDHKGKSAAISLEGDRVYGDVLPDGTSEIFGVLQFFIEACKYPILDYETYEEIDVKDPKYQISEDERERAFKEYTYKINARWGSGAHGDE